MRDDNEIGESVLDGLVELVDAKAHELRECLGALQVARAPEGERSAVNRAIGLLARIKIHLRSKGTLMNLSEQRALAVAQGAAAVDPEARVKHAALALLAGELQALEAAGFVVVHEFSASAA
ncbi:MAG: hypothetical protein KDH15_12645 [Rhodocyclaceae bacterium]|nr:hypothetical protein [Rhodocyclaceae bacterium]